MSRFRPIAVLIPVAAILCLVGAGILYAQLDGADRGIPPVDSTTNFEVLGVEVDVSADSAEKARLEGWRRAQSQGWKLLWSRTNNRPISQAPNLSESVLNSIVAGIVIEQEQISPRRYIARLGVLFDRARTGEMLGVPGLARRSAPLLVIPVMRTGAAGYSFEFRNEWQRAWAQFRTANTPVDYVRTAGTGIDPLVLNLAQARRRGRGWWRMILDEYGAADVIVPEAHLKRLWPGGPVIGTFVARYSPDNREIGRFTLRVERSELVPKLLDEGVRRLDGIYTRALQAGILRPDPSLVVEEPAFLNEIAEQIERASAGQAAPLPGPSTAPPVQVPTGAITAVTIQVDTPNAGAVSQAELAVSRVPGVTSALTTSLALGGTSTMRVTFAGDPAALAAALQAQGWQVSGSGASLRISRPGTGGPEE